MRYHVPQSVANSGAIALREYPDDEHPLSRSLDIEPFITKTQYLRLVGYKFLIGQHVMASGGDWQRWVQEQIDSALEEIQAGGIIINDPSVTTEEVDYGGGRYGGIEVRIEATVAPTMARDMFSEIHAARYERLPWQQQLAGLEDRLNRISAVMFADLEHNLFDSRETFNALMDARDRLHTEEWSVVIKLGVRYTNHLTANADKDSRELFLEIMRDLNRLESQ